MAHDNFSIGAPAAPAPAAPTAEANTAPQETEDTSEGTEGTPAAEAAPVTPSVKKALRNLKLKIDGKEFSEDLPFDLPDSPEAIEYMQRQLQLSKMGQSRAQYASQIEKEVKSFVENLRKDPRKVLSDPTLGVDLKDLARQIIEEEINNSKKSPEQLEKEKLEAEIKSLKENHEKQNKEFQEKEFARLQEVAYEQYDLQITKALDGSDLPKSPYVVKKMADYMLLGLQKGLDISASDVLPLVQEEVQEDLKQMFQIMPDEVVERLVGKDKINSLRKKSVAKAKAAPPTPVTKAMKDVGKTSKETPKVEGKKKTFKDFFGV